MPVPEQVDSGDDTRRVPRGAPQATVLAVAGLDPSGGAGLLADARVIAAHGFHAAGVVTALTEQDSTLCASMQPVDPLLLSRQLARLVDDLEIRGVKIGMLGTPAIAAAAAAALAPLAAEGVPIVVDPVLRASHGVALLAADDDGGALAALLPILRIATVVTPNLEELAILTGLTVRDADDMRLAARRLGEATGAAVLAKGGHLHGNPVDVLVAGARELSVTARRVEHVAAHGTGCALSSDLACRLAMGTPLDEAVLAATERVRARIGEARTVGQGRPFLG